MSKQPNILVILTDQLRRGALGMYGDPNVRTPHIDALGAGGVRFNAACSTYPICVPFRFTMMTGEYAHSRFVPAIEWRMSPAERTLADEFNDGGYRTIYVGKWHLYGGHALLPGHTCAKANLTPVPRCHQGRWQKWLGFELANNPFETYYYEDDDPVPRRVPGFQTDGLFDLTMKTLQASKADQRPFCCVLSVEPPHFPLEAPAELAAAWKDRPLKLPPNHFVRDTHPAPGKKLRRAERPRALDDQRTYYAMIENLDANVGRIMGFLEREGMADNTIVVFVSDHGQMDGAHAEPSVLKDHPFEESIGIPLVVRDLRPGGTGVRRIDDPVSTEDLFPTLLGLAGLKPRQPKPGADLTQLIRGSADRLDREGVLLEFVHDLRAGHVYNEKYWRGLRTRRYKYTVLGGVEGGKPWQFFDLESDPWELDNLIDTPTAQTEVKRHHIMLRERLIGSVDHFVLAPAFGEMGLNLWSPPSP